MKNLRHNYLVVVGLLSLAVLFTVLHFGAEQPPEAQRVAIVATPDTTSSPFDVEESIVLDPALEQEMVSDTARTIEQLSQELAALLAQKEYATVRERLLEMAAQSVTENDKDQLAGALSLLGQLAMEEQDLDTAEVYLMESLDVYEKQANQVGSAQVYMQLGRLHLKSRELARTAGRAYDRVLVARWQISEKQYSEAEHILKEVIADNLAINRFGAAASAYNSLVTLHSKTKDAYQAEQAAMEAARLFAASGQVRRARGILTDLETAGVESWRLIDIENEIERQYVEFKNSVEQIERAKDYRILYNHYRSQGDEQRAWSLRLLANKSLKNVSKRAMYHRQPDVLAVLFVSNDAKDRARDYFNIAKRTFDSKGLEALATQTKRLKRQIL